MKSVHINLKYGYAFIHAYIGFALRHFSTTGLRTPQVYEVRVAVARED